ncbi:MAG: T9SS type A sorting domain-containing protein [Bacteroidota bacterium]
MRHIVCFILFLSFSLSSNAQFFQASMAFDGNDLVFTVRPNPGGGDIITNWSDIEFFLRWPDGSSSFQFGELRVNTLDFPGISIPNNGTNVQGSEVGYTNNWFGTSFAVTPTNTYRDGVEYEVFRIAIDVDPASIDFELVHNNFFFPHYLALISGTGTDLSNQTGNVFYGENAMICSPNCPATTAGSNHVDPGSTAPLLPVELVFFKAEALEGQRTFLEWQTATEENNDYFEVQGSRDGKDFKVIGVETGAGTTSDMQRYATWDEAPAIGKNYYRLKQVDFDGSYEYSEVRVVEFKSRGVAVEIYPNPASDYIQIVFSDSEEEGRLRLFDAAGRLMVDQKVARGAYREQMQVNILPRGVYYLQIKTSGGVQQQKIILQ